MIEPEELAHTQAQQPVPLGDGIFAAVAAGTGPFDDSLGKEDAVVWRF
jgi:hypothetical protein